MNELTFLLSAMLASPALCAPLAQSLGQGLYAYISDNSASCNSVFLVGNDGVLVVDTGFDELAGRKLLTAIRAVTPLPVSYIVNTHYHRDHQAANGIVGPQADIFSTTWTRNRTIEILEHDLPRLQQQLTGEALESLRGVRYRPATVTTDRADIYLGNQQVHLEFHGPAHTMGDLVVEFPAQKAVATGDLFLNRSCPAMDRGSVLNWIRILEGLLATPAEVFVPGHFEVGSRKDLQRFHDYLAELRDQVAAQISAGASWEQVRSKLNMQAYADFRQFPNFNATFEENAHVLYTELSQRKKESK